jgi:hypothetical protein
MTVLDVPNIEETTKYIPSTQFYRQIIIHTKHGAARDGAISLT